jgi:hypothetical protein
VLEFSLSLCHPVCHPAVHATVAGAPSARNLGISTVRIPHSEYSPLLPSRAFNVHGR